MTVALQVAPKTATVPPPNPANPYDGFLWEIAAQLRDKDKYPEQVFSGLLEDLVQQVGASTAYAGTILNKVRHGLVYSLRHPRVGLFGLEVLEWEMVNGEQTLKIRVV